MNKQPTPTARNPTRFVLIVPGEGIALYYDRKVVAFDRSEYVYTREDIQGVLDHPIPKDQDVTSR